MILCVTHSSDYYNIDKVMDYYIQRGIPVLRFDTDLYPGDIDIRFKITVSGEQIWVKGKDYSFELKELTGVWFRKVWSSKALESVDENYRKNVGREISTTLLEFFAALEKEVPTLNKFSLEMDIGGNKYYQLQKAVEAGLFIPKTLISNNFPEVQAFYEEVGGDMIGKLQTSLSFSMGQGEKFFPTTLITKEYLEMMEDTLDVCPMIFQENIPKAYELRIAYVNGNCFAGKINATATQYGQTDWRNSENKSTSWERYKLPMSLVDKLSQFMDKVNLTVGAIDIICRPNGDYVFLEVNPSGEWGMLQKELNYPIAETIAETLLNRIKK